MFYISCSWCANLLLLVVILALPEVDNTADCEEILIFVTFDLSWKPTKGSSIVTTTGSFHSYSYWVIKGGGCTFVWTLSRLQAQTR